jgi:hypothetical protein
MKKLHKIDIPGIWHIEDMDHSNQETFPVRIAFSLNDLVEAVEEIQEAMAMKNMLDLHGIEDQHRSAGWKECAHADNRCYMCGEEKERRYSVGELRKKWKAYQASVSGLIFSDDQFFDWIENEDKFKYQGHGNPCAVCGEHNCGCERGEEEHGA